MIERHTHTHWKQGTDPRILRWLLVRRLLREHDLQYITVCVLHDQKLKWTPNQKQTEKGVEGGKKKKKVNAGSFFFLEKINHFIRTTLIHRLIWQSCSYSRGICCGWHLDILLFQNKFPHVNRETTILKEWKHFVLICASWKSCTKASHFVAKL